MIIQTHDGTFHADEVFACAILTLIHPEAEIVRTRDTIEADYVVDVGGKYDESTGRYDHHQRSFNARRDNGIDYASAGLVWKHHGKEMLRKLELSTDVFETIDKQIIERIDQRDVGQVTSESWEISSIISRMNSNWNEEGDNTTHFARALLMAQGILVDAARRWHSSMMAESKVAEAPSDGEVKWLSRWMPCDKSKLTEKWIAFPQYDQWRAIRTREDIAPPKYWCGLHGPDLIEKSGINGAVFVHKAGFLMINETKEGLREMIRWTGES